MRGLLGCQACARIFKLWSSAPVCHKKRHSRSLRGVLPRLSRRCRETRTRVRRKKHPLVKAFGGFMISRSLLAALVATGVLAGSSAAAQDTIKIAYIDPLSGPGATVGEVGLKTFQFLAEELNAKGGAGGKKFEILPFDNKTNPQESLVQVQKAVDAGARIITQGNGSSVAAALTDWVTRSRPSWAKSSRLAASTSRVATSPDCRATALPAWASAMCPRTATSFRA